MKDAGLSPSRPSLLALELWRRSLFTARFDRTSNLSLCTLAEDELTKFGIEPESAVVAEAVELCTVTMLGEADGADMGALVTEGVGGGRLVYVRTRYAEARLLAPFLGGVAESDYLATFRSDAAIDTVVDRLIERITFWQHTRKDNVANRRGQAHTELVEKQLPLGVELRALRESAELSVSTVAERSDLSFGYVAKIERGDHIPTQARLEKVAHVLTDDDRLRRELMDRRDELELRERLGLSDATASLAVAINHPDVEELTLYAALSKLDDHRLALLHDATQSALEARLAEDGELASSVVQRQAHPA